MITTVGRRFDALGLGPRRALLLSVLFVLGIVVVVGVAARQGMLVTAVTAGVALFAFAVSVRWPLAALIALTVMIPIEQIGTISGFGTISRLAGILFAVAYALPRLGSLRLSAMPLLGWAYLAWALLSSGWAIDPGTSWVELPTLLQLFIVGLLVADFVTRKPEIVRPVLIAYSLSASAGAVLGVVAYLTSGSVDTRAAALQGQNPAQFAAVLLPAFAFGFHETLLGRRRALGAAIALVTLLGILVSGTRGAWLAMAVIPPLVMPRVSPKRLVAGGLGLAVLLVLALQVPGIGQIIADRTGTALSTGGAGRTEIWTVAGVIYRTAPVLGVGYANFPVAYTPAVVLQSGVTTYIDSGRAPHNLVVSSLVELGPVGLMLVALFLLPLAVRRGWGDEATVIRASIAATLVIALFLDVLGNRKQVWLFIGLAAGLWWLRQHAQASTAVSPIESPGSNGGPGVPRLADSTPPHHVPPGASRDTVARGARVVQAELWPAARSAPDPSSAPGSPAPDLSLTPDMSAPGSPAAGRSAPTPPSTGTPPRRRRPSRPPAARPAPSLPSSIVAADEDQTTQSGPDGPSLGAPDAPRTPDAAADPATDGPQT